MKSMLAALVGFCLLGSSWGTQDEEACKGLKELFPEELQDKDGKVVKLDVLKDKIIGVYFSAHWCPPCRAFTPKLVEFRDKNSKEFEIVFVSADKSAKAHKKYMEETKMQWPTLKWRAPEGQALMKKFSVKGIPKLVILTPTGELITEDGRAEVTKDPEHCLAQWKEKEKAQ
ncbi:MAG: redoxin family protein [Planctomycetes bacterium]|nr:redoxin family protein [Planctomycetota bacterium]